MRLPGPHRIDAAAKAHRSLFIAGLLVVCLGTSTGIGVSLWYLYAAVRGLPDQNAVRAAGSMARATTIADVKGRHAFTIFEEQRLQVPLSRVSPNLIRAIVAVEDQRFYDHDGIDVIRVAGAAVNNVMKSRAEQGGSTITQQLARLSFLTPAKTIRRKLQEVVLATRLERTFTKDKILELYLNKRRSSRGRRDHDAGGATHVEQPRRRAHAAGHGRCGGGGVRGTARPRDDASCAVACARLGRGDAAVADVGFWRLCQRRATRRAVPDSARHDE